MPSLTLALLHATADHKQPERNRQQLLALFRQAGEAGAQVALSPELAISGYSFASRADIAPFTESADGPTVAQLRPIARQYGMYLCVGLAEREPCSNLFYNSAIVLDPNGEIVCHYRKMNAEIRWACPGNPHDDNTFATPWGRIGLLICSDSYHSLPARVTVRRGADLILIPANWPPTGLDPREIWQARALENSVHIAVCNRTGLDLSMDCRLGPSAVFNAEGKPLLEHSSAQTQLLLTTLPLGDDGRLSSRCCRRRGDSHLSGDYAACALQRSGISDLTEFLHLPVPGILPLHCLTTASPDRLFSLLHNDDATIAPSLHLLPEADYSDQILEQFQRHCDRNGGAVCCTRVGSRPGHYLLQSSQPPRILPLAAWESNIAQACIDYGPARLLPVPIKALHQPEAICTAAKEGCDLVVCSSTAFSAGDRLLAGVRTIDNVATALCSPEGGGIWITPEGHQRWQEILAEPSATCGFQLDTKRTRAKKFQDRVDYELLLATGRSST